MELSEIDLRFEEMTCGFNSRCETCKGCDKDEQAD